MTKREFDAGLWDEPHIAEQIYQVSDVFYIIFKPEEELIWDGLTYTTIPEKALIFQTEQDGIDYMKEKARSNDDFYHIFHHAEIARCVRKFSKHFVEDANLAPFETCIIERIYDGDY